MNLRALLFPIIGLSVLFGAHLFLYFSTIRFFSITNHAPRNVLAILYLFLSISFIIGIIIIRYSNNILVKAFYFVSTFWLGLIIYLLLAVILAWIVIGAFKLFGLDIKFIIGWLAFSLALLYSFYGVWNAWHPVIKNVEVDIIGLPADWQGKTIVHLSDLHLGRIHGVSFADKIVKQVNALKPDLIVITGDLFDGMGGEPALFTDTLNLLQSAKGIYFVTGNHEVYLGVRGVMEILKDTNIKVLDNELVHLDGLQIVGISYSEFGESRDGNVINNMAGYNSEMPSILLYHSPTSIEQKKENNTEQHSAIYWSPNTDFTATRESGINLQLSGHTHQGQIFPLGLIAKWIYHGYYYGLFKDGDFNLYVTGGVGTWGPPMRTGNKGEIVVIELK